MLAGLQQLAHGAAAEDIARTGGIHRMDALGRFHGDAAQLVRCMAALWALRRIYQGHTVFAKQLLRALLRGNAPQEVDLLITDLHHICLMQAPFDRFLRRSLTGPQRLAQVGIQ